MIQSQATTPVRVESTPMAEFLASLAQLNNGAMTEIAEFTSAQSPAYRSRLIERCASLISAIADLDAA
ncbi:hypothetical protein [Burkholderia glumae]|uniref:hypothetical protein n=1 Tax=Burkholderia glumae TaxID=337 RepID=UPI0021519DB6|nr:hypothetical protein [Burkholderia glumae]